MTCSLHACPHMQFCFIKHYASQYALGTKGGGRVFLQALELLRLDNNRLSGSLPASWGALRMFYVDLASNMFTGSVPASWSGWSQVREPLLAHAATCHIGRTQPPSDVFACRSKSSTCKTISFLGPFPMRQICLSSMHHPTNSLTPDLMLCQPSCSSCILPTIVLLATCYSWVAAQTTS